MCLMTMTCLSLVECLQIFNTRNTEATDRSNFGIGWNSQMLAIETRADFPYFCKSALMFAGNLIIRICVSM